MATVDRSTEEYISYGLEELVDLFVRRGKTSAVDDAILNAAILERITRQDKAGDLVPRDKKCSKIIASGYVEACCKWACQDRDTIVSPMVEVLENLNQNAFLPKTNQAMRARSGSIEQALNDLAGVDSGHPFLQFIKGILSKTSLVSENVAVSCRQCKKIMENEEIKRCSRCKFVAYCSRECQTMHWREHKQYCKKQSISQRQAETVDSIAEAGKKVLAQNLHRLCAIASLKGYSVMECVFVIDLTRFTKNMELEVLSFDEFLKTMPEESVPAKKRSGCLRNLEALRDLGQAPCAIIGWYRGKHVSMIEGVPEIELPYPGAGWIETQRYFEAYLPDDIAALRQNPERCESVMKQMSKPRTGIL